MPLSVNSLIAIFLQWCERNRRPRTVDAYKQQLDKWAAHVGDVAIEQLTPWHLSSWGRSWHQVQAVQRLLQFAVIELEALQRNPFARVKRPPMGQRKLILPPRSLARLLRAARPAFRRFLLGMRATFARPQEIAALRWSMLQSQQLGEEVDQALLAGRAIFVMTDYKARCQRADPNAPRVLLINRRLARLLLRLRRSKPREDEHVFKSAAGRPWTRNIVRCCMRRLRKRRAIALPTSQEKIVAYSIRHSMATWACSKNVRDKMLAELLGHASTRTVARYQHLQLDHLRQVVESLESIRPRDCRRKDQSESS